MNPPDLISGARLLPHGNGRRGRQRQDPAGYLCPTLSRQQEAVQ